MVRIGLIGRGNWGKNYIPVLASISNVKLVWVETRNYYNYLDKVDAVIIATPLETHYDIAKSCLLANKHVLVEKPFCETSEQAQDLVCIAEDKHKILMVGHIYMYHQGILRIKESITNGLIGDITGILSRRLGTYGSENAFWEMGSHDMYIFKYLLDEVPTEIKITGSKPHPYINIKYKKINAFLECSTNHDSKVRELIVYGTNGVIVFDEMKKEEKLVLYNDTKKVLPINTSPLDSQCYEFVDSILFGTYPKSDGIEGLINIKILEHGLH